MRTSLVLAALLTVGAVAWAEEPPQATPPAAEPAAQPLTVSQAADAVLAAMRLPDAAALKVLAAQDDPDPWLVADELIGRGAHSAAEAFAGAAPRIDT